MPKKMNMAGAVRQLEASRKLITKERDKLRDLESEIGQLADDADEALASLRYAIDALSSLA